MNLPPILKKKLGPFPVIAWAGIAVGGFLISRVIKGRTAALTGDNAETADPYSGLAYGGDGSYYADDYASQPYGVPYTGGAGYPPPAGYGGGGSPVPPASPPPPPTGTPVVTPDPFRSYGPHQCPEGYYWNGRTCARKTFIPLAPRYQPGATEAGHRGCPDGWHWNGFTCVPNVGPSSRSVPSTHRG